MGAVFRGLIRDVWNWERHLFDWAKIEGVDFREWLAGNGATSLVLDSSLVRFAYTGLFANLAGEDGAGGLVAANTAVQSMMSIAGYKGSFVWQMKAGTGETLVLPLYDLLATRGVQFHFFHEVIGLRPALDGHIDRITLRPQVKLTVPRYDPIAVLPGGQRVWPDHPLYEQIDPAQAKELQERHIDLENPWADWIGEKPYALELNSDFDEVILAIPVGALPHCCPEILATNERWRAMVEQVKTTATVSSQLWLKRSLSDLGFDRAAWHLPETDAPNAVTYNGLPYSWIDQTLTAPYEAWPAGESPQLIAYFTGALDDPPVIPLFSDHAFPILQQERARDIMAQWLRTCFGWFLPKAAPREFPQGLDFKLLAWPSTEPNPTARQRFDAQFFRANIAPALRYTLSVPGSAAHRLKPGHSGYRNLFLAGDWTDFGLNMGYIEGAVISGLKAADALAHRRFGLSKRRVIAGDLTA